MTEEWKQIDGYDDKYMISNMGRIKKKNKITNKYVIVNSSINKGGYLVGSFTNNDGVCRSLLIHKVGC